MVMSGDKPVNPGGKRANEDDDGCSVGVLDRLLNDSILGRDVLSAEVLLRVLG